MGDGMRVGSVVRLKSGGPLMVVGGDPDLERRVAVWWTGADGGLSCRAVPIACLGVEGESPAPDRSEEVESLRERLRDDMRIADLTSESGTMRDLARAVEERDEARAEAERLKQGIRDILGRAQ